MLDTEGRWSEALTSNNIRAIMRSLRKLTDESFSRCQGLWMFLDRSSFTKVHVLLQRLSNLLSLAQWVRKQLSSGVGIPCVVCRETLCSSDVRCGCRNRAQRGLKQHIWLGRLVQWWGIMGLLPKCPEPHEVKRISQMWREIVHRHRRACLQTPGWGSFIQGMVTQLDKRHGCIWTSEDCTGQCYPPPNLQALLKLVLVPRIDNVSVQAILMYFILDMENFLQCKDDLLRSFCHAFTIPSSFLQQVRAFWMLDHGHIKASLELFLSPRAAVPQLPWQHSLIIHCLLTRKQPRLALRYIYCTRPAIETTEDAKLCADVLIQNSCFSEAWSLLKRGHTEGEDMVMHFLLSCNRFCLHAEALKHIPIGHNVDRPPCPLSAKLYQTQTDSSVSPEELLRLLKEAVMEMRSPQPKTSVVVWPEHPETKLGTGETFLSTQALRHLTPSPSPMDVGAEAEQTATPDQTEEEQPVVPAHFLSEDMSSESVSSFTSTSTLPLLGQCCPHVCESTLTQQRVSSVLTDGESREEEQQGKQTSSSVNILLDRPDLMVTPDGTTVPVFLSNFNKDMMRELVLPAEDREDSVKAGVFSNEDSLSVDAVSAEYVAASPALHRRMSPSPQVCSNDVGQAVPFIYESQVESQSFLSPDCEIIHGLSNVTDPQSSWLSQKDQSDCIPPQILVLMRQRHLTLLWKNKMRPSVAPSQVFSYSLINFRNSTAKQKGVNVDVKQEDKRTGWSSLGKASQGAIRSGRTRSRKSKRVKRI
ncbi:hypothetical protein Q5P01_020299 [Channa striata]|uniref:ELYS-like domain-containing protein n=1 Tax=Channa striata TaxID=64152 RepID=A0AA88LY51_CHASR|nr:hypothetical protein Q5P01_020299 [Channa striata]